MIANQGRRVQVRAEDGETVSCFLAGQRAVVGDVVRFVPARGEGGKLVGIERRRSALVRVGHGGRRQVLAANLEGIFVVMAPVQPPFKAALLDRYAVAASAAGFRLCAVLNKVDQGIPEAVEEALALRAAEGLETIRTSARDGRGLDGLRAHVARYDAGPWALVGHSGVGKTSLVAALLPGQEVGEVGEVGAYGGRHTTTGSRLFALPGGGELVDSPGIRTFTPGGLTVDDVREHFPGIPRGRCKYRDCQHREGEEGCGVAGRVAPDLLASYRHLLEEVRALGVRARSGP